MGFVEERLVKKLKSQIIDLVGREFNDDEDFDALHCLFGTVAMISDRFDLLESICDEYSTKLKEIELEKGESKSEEP